MSDYKLIDVTRLTKFKEKLLGILTYSSPIANTSSTSIEFIDTVSQSNGKISASKKKVSTFAGGNTTGLVPAPGTNASGKFLKSDSGWSDLPTASTTNSGIVKLDSSTNSDAENVAATPKAIKAVYAAASTAGANAGANAASSYATAAKNSASNASTYATNAKNSADSAADAASTAVTNKIKNLKYDDPSASTATSTTFISNISQTNGAISATKKTLPTASTTTAGIVKLTNTTGSTDTTTAATPNSVTQAINNLTGSVTDSSATETSTIFISDISQTKGVVTATKKKIPTFAGSSQPGIVSASEGLSENYLLNATGGWTSIDEELDPDSTNPVQNKIATLNMNGVICTSPDDNNKVKTVNMPGFVLYAGATIKVLFQNACTVSYPQLKVGDTAAKTIMAYRGGSPVDNNGLKASSGKWRGSSSAFDEVWQSYTMLELMYDGTNWVIMGDPVIESYFTTDSGYEKKANGLIKQWGYIDKTANTNTVISLPVTYTRTDSYTIFQAYGVVDNTEDVFNYPLCTFARTTNSFIIRSASDVTGSRHNYLTVGY